jgi:hypothetical protein
MKSICLLAGISLSLLAGPGAAFETFMPRTSFPNSLEQRVQEFPRLQPRPAPDIRGLLDKNELSNEFRTRGFNDNPIITRHPIKNPNPGPDVLHHDTNITPFPPPSRRCGSSLDNIDHTKTSDCAPERLLFDVKSSQ